MDGIWIAVVKGQFIMIILEIYHHIVIDQITEN